jgi:putative ABC transport system permease protein
MIDTVVAVVRTSLELGLLYGIAVLGLAMAFRITGFADLTMEGGFTTGAAVTAVAMAGHLNPALALLLGAAAGALAGVATASLHSHLGVSKLLSGIITMTVLYSLNLRVMGRPNYSIPGQSGLFDLTSSLGTLPVCFVAAGLILVLVGWFLRTELGIMLRACGETGPLVCKLGGSPAFYAALGLAVANSVIALSGGLVAQLTGFADIGMGTGIIVSSLAALMIGEALLPPRSVRSLLAAVFLGSFVYQLAIAVGLRLGINPWDLKLATGILLVLAIVLEKHVFKSRAAANIGASVL